MLRGPEHLGGSADPPRHDRIAIKSPVYAQTVAGAGERYRRSISEFSASRPGTVPGLLLAAVLAVFAPVGAFAQATATGITHQRADGNRVIDGRGNLPAARTVDLALGRPVIWVVGTAAEDDSFWVAVLDDGSVRPVSLKSGAAREVPDFSLDKIDGPPILAGRRLLFAPGGDGSVLSHAVPLSGQDRVAYVTRGGGLRIVAPSSGQQWELAVSALADARVLSDEAGRALLLSDPTDRYPHGALGDIQEAASMSLIETRGRPGIVRSIEFPQPFVFEGLAPVWTDWDRDGEREIVATLSSHLGGAKLVLYDEHGNLLAQSPEIGTGSRWRHVIAVAPFGPGGEMELAEVLTPHLGGVVQFFRWQGQRLVKVADISGYTSHVYGSRNLDLAVAGDFDGDGRVELLLPVQNRTRLAAIRRTVSGAERAFELPLPARLSSNLSGVTSSGGDTVVAAGLADGTLRFYLPR